MNRGYSKITSDSIIFEEKELFRLRGYNPFEKIELYEVNGEEMEPTLLPKEIIVCQPSNIKKIEENDLIIVKLKGKFKAKRVSFNEHREIILKNDNPAFPGSIELEKESLGNISQVFRKVSNSLIPYHEIISKEKFNIMEENLNELRRELEHISKKIHIQKNRLK